MAGHSRWANIKRRKAKVDAERGKIFTRLSREIIVAARLGGGDPEANPRLRAAVQRAREANIPMENIQRAIQRATGEAGGAALEELVYEGYGPEGVAILLKVVTDNRNRTAAEVRHIFHKYGGSLGEAGCVAWLFEPRGLVVVEGGEEIEERLLLAAVEAGAEDVRREGGQWEVITVPEDTFRVRDHLAAEGFVVQSAQVAMVPKSTVPVADRAAVEKLLRLVDALEDHDDVQEVYANFDIPVELLEGHEGLCP